MKAVCIPAPLSAQNCRPRMVCLSVILLGASSITPATWASPQAPQQPEVRPPKSAQAELQQEVGPPTPLATLIEEGSGPETWVAQRT